MNIQSSCQHDSHHEQDEIGEIILLIPIGAIENEHTCSVMTT